MVPNPHIAQLMPRIALMLVVLIIPLTHAHAIQTTYYVDINCGDDAWSGLSEVCAAPDGPKRTIQSAIDLTVAGDTVQLADGLYRTSGTPMTFRGKDITLKSANGPTNCIIDGQGSHLAFEFSSGETTNAKIHGLSFINGGGGGGTYLGSGGAVAIVNAGITIENCLFMQNQTEFGGAIYFDNADVRLLDCEFIENTAYATECDAGGGAIIGRDSTLRVENCTFDRNNTRIDFCHGGNGGSSGGAMGLLRCQTTIIGSVFSNNDARSYWDAGGALALSGGSIRIVRCVFSSNTTGSKSGVGGAISTYQVDIAIENSLFFRNSASGFVGDGAGGAIYLNGTGRIVNTSFAFNGSGEGGALIIEGSGSTITNSVFVANNSPQGSAVSHRDGSLDIQYSYFESGASSVLGTATWGLGNILSGDPGFVGPPSDLRLKRNSPLIDAGDSFAVTIPPLPAIAHDLDGNPRLRDDPGTPDTGVAPAGMAVVDIGAYEFQGSSCEADCDWSTGPGVLDVFDFLCFQNAFVAADPYACDCDTSTGVGVCDINDFLCFQIAFTQGCP